MGFSLSTAVTLFLIVPTLVMAAGMLGVIPLTGVVTPFLSYGGSAMVANFAALGILMSVQSHSTSSETSEPFRRPARYLGGALAVAAAGLVLLLLDVQVLRADDYVVKPHLSMQADGVRRFQYNQRVLDVARLIPRGSIFDRRGLPARDDGRRDRRQRLATIRRPAAAGSRELRANPSSGAIRSAARRFICWAT